MVELSRHVLTLSVTERIIQVLAFTRIELTTSALVDVHGYLQDHSGDEIRHENNQSNNPATTGGLSWFRPPLVVVRLWQVP